MGLAITSEELPGGTCVRVAGEVDVSNAGELRDALDAALAADPERVVCNLAEVPYIDSTGIGVLVGFAHRSAEAGCAFVVEEPQRNVARVLSLLGLDAELGIASA